MTNRIFHIVLTCFLLASCANHRKITTKSVDVSTNETGVSDSTPLVQGKEHYHTDSGAVEKESSLSVLDYYENAFKLLEDMVEDRRQINFKDAVYHTENAYYLGLLDYKVYNGKIENLANLCKAWMISNDLKDYHSVDSSQIHKNGAIFTLMNDTIYIVESENTWFRVPYQYNFSDFLAEQHWDNQFVTTLLIYGEGNCHSLPYLYKILADELNTDAYLSLAPNHIYIKQRSKEWGWYNTELTSGEFPTDAWVKASGYITLDAIRNGIYMDTLSQKQNIALCIYDLAKGYLAMTSNYENGFVIRCCDLVLKYHPSNINALILKAETLKNAVRRSFDKG